jgi:uncharacterized protein YndB with AHSA1/START domain
MNNNDHSSEQAFQKTVRIHAPVLKVWNSLTDPLLMKRWMYEGEIAIITDWKVGHPFTIRGASHGATFENRGKVLQFERGKALQYTHLSSISALPDEPASYTVLEFSLMPAEEQTVLTFGAHNFPTESIYRHFAFYWNVALEVLKKDVEGLP